MQVKKQLLELDMKQTTNWFQIGKGVCQGCISSPCLFNLYAEYILRNLYAGQDATVRTGHETTDWFQIGKGVHQGLYCHLYLTYMQSTS